MCVVLGSQSELLRISTNREMDTFPMQFPAFERCCRAPFLLSEMLEESLAFHYMWTLKNLLKCFQIFNHGMSKKVNELYQFFSRQCP